MDAQYAPAAKQRDSKLIGGLESLRCVILELEKEHDAFAQALTPILQPVAPVALSEANRAPGHGMPISPASELIEILNAKVRQMSICVRDLKSRLEV